MAQEKGINEDRVLACRAAKGDRDAFAVLVERNQDRIYNLAFRLTGGAEAAWDLSQEAFLRAFASIRNFRGDSAFYTWLYRIVLNVHMNQTAGLAHRTERRAVRMDAGVEGERGSSLRERLPDPAAGADPSEAALARERERAVQEAIMQLPPDQRSAILLRDMEGFSYEEIGRMLDLPLGTVRSRLHRAREQLKERLKEVF